MGGVIMPGRVAWLENLMMANILTACELTQTRKLLPSSDESRSFLLPERHLWDTGHKIWFALFYLKFWESFQIMFTEREAKINLKQYQLAQIT